MTAKAIGPTFAAELDAGGIQDRRFSWGDDGQFVFHPEVSQADRDAVLAVYAAHDPMRAPVPQFVTPLQARRALLAAGKLAEVQAYVDAATADVQLAWEYATEIRRDNPIILAAAGELEWTEQQLDQLFIDAAGLV